MSRSKADAAMYALGYVPEDSDKEPGTPDNDRAAVLALLAIEERLGELVEQQRLSNALAAAPPFVSVFRSNDEFDQVAATARRLLGLDTDPEGGSAE